MTGSATLLSVLFGVATTKIIAVVAGTTGVALMGLYRNLGGLASRSLIFGLDTTVVQRISTARGDRRVSETVGAVGLALAAQGLVILLGALAFAEILARWLFGGPPSAGQLLEVRLVLAMAFVNLALQVATALLSGRVEVRRVAAVSVVAGAATLAAIHPLLRLGNVGLALNVGSGSTVGAALAAFFVWRTYGPSWVRVPLRALLVELSRLLRRSTFLVLHPLVMMTAVLSVQSAILGSFGLSGLGSYNAVTTIVDTALMVLMASARTFFLPRLGQLDDAGSKAEILNRGLRLNGLLAASATLVLISGAALWVPLLFSGRFELAVGVLPPLSLGLVGQVVVWSYAMLYLSQARYALFFGLDVLWALVYAGGTLLVARWGGSLTAAAWVYSASYLFSAVLYASTAVKLFGASMLSRENAWLLVAAVAGTSGACLLRSLGLVAVDVAVLLAGLGGAAWLLRRSFAGTEGGDVP